MDLHSGLPGTARTTSELIDLGVGRYELRTDLWEHPYFGVARVVGADPVAPLVRISDASALLPVDGAIGGWSSAHWQGVRYLDGRDRFGRLLPVRLHETDEHRIKRRPGIDPTRCRLHPGEVVEHDGQLVTSLPRALYDEMRLAVDLTEAVIVLDMGVSRLSGGARTTLQAVSWLIARHVKTRGIVQARAALELATDRSNSPLESRTRVFTVLTLGMHGWWINRPVFGLAGNLLGVPDLIDPLTGLVVESDGGGHRDEDRHADDNVREETFEDANCTVVRVTSYDHRRPADLAARITAGQRRALSRDTSRDRWTLSKPAWWAGSQMATTRPACSQIRYPQRCASWLPPRR